MNIGITSLHTAVYVEAGGCVCLYCTLLIQRLFFAAARYLSTNGTDTDSATTAADDPPPPHPVVGPA